MIETIKKHIAEVQAFSSTKKEEIENFRIKYLGKKGLLNDFFAEFKNVANDQKKEFGQVINSLKKSAEDKVSELKESLESKEETKGVYGDLSRPGEVIPLGSRHPISIDKNKIIDIFLRIGFNVSEVPEFEDVWHNFSALKYPVYHPDQDIQHK